MTIGGVRQDAPRLSSARYERFPLGTWRARAEPHAATDSVRLVLVETPGVAWQSHVLPHEYDQTVLLVRGRAESLDAFSQRAAQRAHALQGDRRAIRLTLMLLAPRFDSRASASRLVLARALMTQATDLHRRKSKLVLCADDESDPKVQAKLMAFVDLLMSEPSSWTLPVQVKFGRRGLWRARDQAGH